MQGIQQKVLQGTQEKVTSGQVIRKGYRRPQEDGSTILEIFYQCSECLEEVQGAKGYVKHMSEIHQTTIKPFEDKNSATSNVKLLRFPDGEGALECPICQEQFPETGMEDLRKHGKAVHGDLWDMITSNVARRGPDGHCYYVCEFCETHFSSAVLCTRHVASQHGEVWTLTGNDKDTNSSTILDYLHQDRYDASVTFPRKQDMHNRMQVVSLGYFCGVKFSMQRMGLGASHMPFDWIRSSIQGVKHFVQHGFDDFFSVTSQRKIEGEEIHLYRSSRHCFFHDDITQPEVQEKLQRRTTRFLSVSEDTKDILFVRSCASTSDLLCVDELYAELLRKFGASGQRVLLLVIIDGHDVQLGPIVHDTNPSIIFYLQPFDPKAMNPDGGTYCHAIACAANLALDVPENASPLVGFGSCSNSSKCFSLTNSATPPYGLVKGSQGGVIHVKPWDAGLVAVYGGVSYPCFDESGAKHINLTV
jgi:uncharacterized C2H2 Zn-finger protein